MKRGGTEGGEGSVNRSANVIMINNISEKAELN